MGKQIKALETAITENKEKLTAYHAYAPEEMFLFKGEEQFSVSEFYFLNQHHRFLLAFLLFPAVDASGNVFAVGVSGGVLALPEVVVDSVDAPGSWLSVLPNRGHCCPMACKLHCHRILYPSDFEILKPPHTVAQTVAPPFSLFQWTNS